MSWNEIVGYDEIVGGEMIAGLVGDDDEAALYAMAGAADPSQNAQLQALRARAANPMGPASLAANFRPRVIDVQSVAARAPRKLLVNFYASNVEAGAVADISIQPQVPFRGERLVVPSDIAGSFDILDVIVGNRSQFGAAGRMAARVASEQAFGVNLHLDTASVAMSIILRVENTSGQASRFLASLFGTAAIQ